MENSAQIDDSPKALIINGRQESGADSVQRINALNLSAAAATLPASAYNSAHCPLSHVMLYSQEYERKLVALTSVLQAACKEGQSLKTTIGVLVFVGFVGGAVAQQQAAAPVRMECRELS